MCVECEGGGNVKTRLFGAKCSTGVDLVASGELFHNFFDAKTGFEILEDRGSRHSRTFEGPGTADFAWNAFHGVSL